MSKTLAPSVVTNRDPKGTKFMSIVGAAYDKDRLNEDEAQRVNDAPGLADLIHDFIEENRHEVPPILKRVTSVEVSGTKRFVADEATLKEANIGWTGDNFKKFFRGKVEENVPDGKIAIHRLEQDSLDKPIRKEIGQEREETTLAHLMELIKKQSQGQDGVLLTNGYANIAYIKGNDGNLWAVNAHWHSGSRCWGVGADSVENPDDWDAGDQVISCDC